MNNPKLYTVKEAAKLVGVSTNTLYKYLEEDRIHAARGSALQGRFRIPQSALEEFLGVKLSSPNEPEVPTVSVQPLDLQNSASTESSNTGKLENLPAQAGRKTGIPIKIARFLLILALLALLVDLFVARSVSLTSQITRIFFLTIMLILAYQEGGYRHG